MFASTNTGDVGGVKSEVQRASPLVTRNSSNAPLKKYVLPQRVPILRLELMFGILIPYPILEVYKVLTRSSPSTKTCQSFSSLLFTFLEKAT